MNDTPWFDKIRIIKIAIFISFLFCYLEWGGSQSSFIYQMEYSIFSEDDNVSAFTHPFILLPLIGQVILLVSIFLNERSRILTRISIIFLSVLVLMILLVGVLSLNIKIIASTLPFLLLSLYYFFSGKKVLIQRNQ
jgi:hypothetical protein